jgi:D-ribose pyranase
MHKTSTILNGQLASVVTTLRYGEAIVIADAGLPVPPSTPSLELGLVPGVPSTLDVASALRDNLVLLEVRIAREMAEVNSRLRRGILDLFEGTDLVKEVAHMDGIEAVLASARLVIQTGEVSPYGNVVLLGGLDFFDISMAGGESRRGR